MSCDKVLKQVINVLAKRIFFRFQSFPVLLCSEMKNFGSFPLNKIKIKNLCFRLLKGSNLKLSHCSNIAVTMCRKGMTSQLQHSLCRRAKLLFWFSRHWFCILLLADLGRAPCLCFFLASLTSICPFFPDPSVDLGRYFLHSL